MMFVEWIEMGLKKPGKSRVGLAEALRIHPSQITRMLRDGGRRIKADELARIAEYLEEPVPVTDPAVPMEAKHAPPEFLGERDLPVFSAVEGGPGEMVISTDAIDYVPRPWFLKHVKEGYALIVTGDSMIPVYEPGDMVLINPRLPVLNGRNAVFAGGESVGEFRATVKRLIRSTPAEWIVQQWNPSFEFSLDKRQWPKAFRIVGKYDGG